MIGKLLGHTQPATTARYAHLDADPMRRAADLIGDQIAAAMDRIVDFADIGIGTWRWYIFNIADSAVTVSIGALLLISIFAPGAIGSRPKQPDVAAAQPQRAEGSSGDEAAG